MTGPTPATPLTWKDDFVCGRCGTIPLCTRARDAVFVGYGIVAPEWGWNDYEGADVKGKIVVTLVNDPGLRDSTIFRGKILTYYGRWTYKIEEARRQGAAGILMIHTTESATYPWTTVLSGWTGPQVRLETPPSSLVVAGWLQQDAAAATVQEGGKGSVGAQRCRPQARVQGCPTRPRARRVGAERSSATPPPRTSSDALPGRGPHAREAVLIGGHYDHFGIGTAVDGDSIYNGAEDNASGTAAVLTAAEAFVRSGVRPGRSMVFIGFTAEESGLLGSQALATNPPFPLKDMAAILNLDVMNLYGKTRDFSALGLDQSSLGKTSQQAAAAEGLKISTNEEALIQGLFFRSDHFSLARVGVPGTYAREWVGLRRASRRAGGRSRPDEYVAKRYHQPQDNVQPWFNYDGAVQQLRVTVRTAVAVADAPASQPGMPTSEFREAGEARDGGRK